ncbi:hypothetical protein PtA15_9A616 [Puccinia triticina]|uniref:Uncharacterized protein n=1 Tax=Puccinia triticina TaxID=208348 RepID=A0ABY7CTB9_9BASI|nr:uncharacterized protein PtA15_9A616 [Puccinia triticina]WAQ88489.1 hypothetical protein PtA15_9A616 [Puccinia triticina]
MARLVRLAGLSPNGLGLWYHANSMCRRKALDRACSYRDSLRKPIHNAPITEPIHEEF